MQRSESQRVIFQPLPRRSSSRELGPADCRVSKLPNSSCPANRCEITADQHLRPLVFFGRREKGVLKELFPLDRFDAIDHHPLTLENTAAILTMCGALSGSSFCTLAASTLIDQRRSPPAGMSCSECCQPPDFPNPFGADGPASVYQEREEHCTMTVARCSTFAPDRAL